MKNFAKMDIHQPAAGSVVEIYEQGDVNRVVKVLGYFEETRSVFIYEAPYTPEVKEVDDIYWCECKVGELTSLFQDMFDIGMTAEEMAMTLIKDGWTNG